jgi:hypothetical protein
VGPMIGSRYSRMIALMLALMPAPRE